MPIFFVTIDVERALGLEAVIPNFHIICLDDSERVAALIQSKVKIFCLEKADTKFNPKIKSTNQVLSHPKVLEYIRNNNGDNGNQAKILVFKTNEGIEEIAKSNNLHILEVPSSLNKMFEDKVSQYEILSTTIDKKYLPKILITQRLGEIKWEDAIAFCDTPKIVIQFPHGNSGKTTYFIKAKQEFENLRSLYPLRITKIAEYIEGISYTINACITKYGVISGGLNEQITGIEILTSSSGGTCGNDWTQIGLTEEKRKEMIDVTKLIGNVMIEKGFKGLFGIDFVVNEQGVYVIEINARQIASIPMHTKIQLKEYEMPLILAHLIELAEMWDDFSALQLPEAVRAQVDGFKTANLDELSAKYNQPKSASQIIMRNIKHESITINGQFTTGIYKYGGDNTGRIQEDTQNVLKIVNIDEDGDKSLCLLKIAYDVSAVNDMEGFFISTNNKGKIINPMIEIARLQFPFSALNENKTLREWIIESVNTLKRHLLK